MPATVTELGVSKDFPSMNAAISYVNPPMDFSSFIQQYVILCKPYASEYNVYMVEYQRLEDHMRKEAQNKKTKAKYMAKYNPAY